MQKRFLKLAALFLAVALLVGASCFAVADNDTAKLVFRGMTMQGANDGSVQAFLDIDIRKIETNGVGFTLMYNREWVEISDAESNAVLEKDEEGRFLQINNEDFPAGFLIQPGGRTMSAEAIDDKSGKVKIWLSANPAVEGASAGRYVEERIVDGFPTQIIKANTAEGLHLASISFRIKSPSEFAKLTGDEVSKIFSIATNEVGENVFQISYVDRSVYPAVVFYDKNEHLTYEFEVTNTVLSIEAMRDHQTVTAAEIYRSGTEDDLISYLNVHMQDIVIRYTDGTQISDTMRWGEREKDFTIDVSWDPKGGTYHVSQKYNDKTTINVTVEVLPVAVLGYSSDKDYIVYPVGSVPTDIKDEAMDFPLQANPIFDQAIPSSANYSINLESAEWQEEIGESGTSFFDGAEGEYTFKTLVEEFFLPPWATVSTEADAVRVLRCIGEVTPTPEETDISAETDESGLLMITVSSAAGFDENTEFFVRLPNGEQLSKQDFSSAPARYTVEFEGGNAIIKIKGDINADGVLKRTQQYINMGERLGAFQLAVQAPDQFRSSWVSFTSNSRRNIYIDSTADNYSDGNYTFDYTDGKSALFPVYSDSTLETFPLRLVIPGNDVVATTYDGTDGLEPGGLHTIQVTDWQLTEGVLSEVGSTAVLKGTLAKADYVNYGEVENPDNITVTLRVTILEAVPEEELSEIEDFVFDTQTVGFGSDKVQTEMFTARNIGAVDISGLSISITGDSTLSTDASKAFVLSSEPAYLVRKGEDVIFQISTKVGAPLGEYSATVSIGSNRTRELLSFKISFKVVEDEVYRVEVVSNDIMLGNAYVVGSATYPAGDTVQLVAEPEEDCEFLRWEVTRGVADIQIDSTDPLKASFIMQEQAVEGILITAIFDGGMITQLKLSGLWVKEADDSIEQLLDSRHLPTNFDPLVREYYVIVSSGTEQNKAEFRLMNLDIEGEAISVTAAINGDDIPIVEDTVEIGRYTTDLFDLVNTMPDANELEITLTCGDVSKTYTVYICRKVASEDLVEFAYGNSPYGLIMRDSVKFDTPQAQQAAKDAFAENENRFVNDEFTPAGGLKNVRYRSDAWGIFDESNPGEAVNYDKDETALFVYTGQMFRDPGIQSLTDSLGTQIDMNTVKRRLKVNVMSASNPATLMQDFNTIDSTTLNLPTGAASSVGDDIDVLTNLRIRPDVYQIEYIYRDYDGSELIVRRPVIILTENGDVDISGEAGAADAVKIKGRYRERLPYESLPTYVNGGFLYKYRVCDANNDGDINSVDANLLQAGATPVKYYSEGV